MHSWTPTPSPPSPCTNEHAPSAPTAPNVVQVGVLDRMTAHYDLGGMTRLAKATSWAVGAWATLLLWALWRLAPTASTAAVKWLGEALIPDAPLFVRARHRQPLPWALALLMLCVRDGVHTPCAQWCRCVSV